MNSAISNGAYLANNSLQLLASPGQYFVQLERMLAEASHCIHLQTYIFKDDQTGQQVANWLIQAAQRNIPVHVLVDGYASQWLANDFVEKLRNAGVYFSFFQPLLKSKHFYVGRRMHHKMVVVDGKEALIGGINIADRYNKIPGEESWMNMDLHIQGEAALALEKRCIRIWNKNTQRKRLEPSSPIYTTIENGSPLRVRFNDWAYGMHEISKSYIEMFHQAEKEIIIICSYFIPGSTFRRLMQKAARRGAQIQVVVAGPSDVMTAKYAERYLYDWMLRNKIRVYEYQNQVLHAKVAQRDGAWMTIGSYNLNDLSAKASLEANVDCMDAQFVAEARQVMLSIIENHTQEITETKNWSVFARFGHWIWYKIFRGLLYLFTFYMRKE